MKPLAGRDWRFRILTAQAAADSLSRIKQAADDDRWQRVGDGGIRNPAGLDGCSPGGNLVYKVFSETDADALMHANPLACTGFEPAKRIPP